VGESGSGKSTLLRLLLAFERPLSGSIYYDNQDLAGIDLDEVRRQIGVVLQNDKLLPGDILTNIIGSAPLTADDAWEAVRVAGLEDDIKALPMGMYTTVTEGGKTLSGGQRQRLMIARAVVRKPKILIFDEATSALDNRTQAIVSRALDAMGTTRIVIAHRLSTIRNADRIYVLDKGVVSQAGTYDELMSQPGGFAELAKRQLL
jgi:ATP-binding cassette subfamily C protein